MAVSPARAIAPLPAEELARRLPELGFVLHACVHAGASVNFVLPFSEAEAETFWRDKVLPAAEAGSQRLLAAQAGGRIVGTVMLGIGTPPNQPHRAEVLKLLVDPAHRRRGLARALMAELERLAAALGRSLLTLDTRTGDPAERLYAALGFTTAGVIPGYCLDPFERRLEAATLMYKVL